MYSKGTVDFQKNITFAVKLFRLADKMQLDSLADETAKFIGGHAFDADVVFSWFDLFARKGNAVGLNLLSKVCVLLLRSRSLDNFNLCFILPI